MTSFESIHELQSYILQMPLGTDKEIYLSILKENADCIDLLKLAEKTIPVNQKYHLFKQVLFVTFSQKKRFFKLGKLLDFKIGITFIGFPFSISKSGILTKKDRVYSDLPQIIKDFSETIRGTVVVLNSEVDIHKGHLTESTFVFYNTFEDFEEYIKCTRSSYHKKITQSMDRGGHLSFRQIRPDEFTEEHYELYLSVHERMKQTLITMPLSFFRNCDAQICEIRDEYHQLLAFVQLKEISGTLYFILGGFRKNEEEYRFPPTISHIDLYYNMLLFIIKYGITHDYQKIVLGQTAAESKSKLGAVEELTYLHVTSSNPVVRLFFEMFPSIYSFQPYGIEHKVFKETEKQKTGFHKETMA